MRKRLGLLFMVCGLALLLADAGLLLHNHLEDRHAASAAQQLVLEMEDQLKDADGRTGGLDTEMTVALINGRPCVGILSIPAIERLLPVMAELKDEYLREAPCRYAGSSKTDDLVVAGHNYRNHFGPLDNLRPGDEVYLTDMDGRTTRYEVTDTEVLMGTDVEKMTDGSADLTLFTCTYSGTGRITVRCDKSMS